MPASGPARRRAAAAVWALGAVALLAILCGGPIASNDVWLLLRTGELILDEGSVPTVERFSFTARGRPLVPHEWGSALIFALVWRAAGPSGLLVLKFLLAGGAYLLLVRAAAGMGAGLPALTAPLALSMALVAARLLERPHLWSFLLAAAFLCILDRHRRRGGHGILWLLPLQTAWANLHGGFPLGWMLAAAYAGIALLDRIRGRGAARSWPLLVGVTAALPLACLPNPVGLRLLAFPFRMLGDPMVRSAVYEWAPPFSDIYRGSYLFREYLALAVGAALLLLWRLPAGPPRWLAASGAALATAGLASRAPGLPAAGLLAVGAGVLAGRGRPPRAPWLAALAAFFLSTRMNRAVADFALLALPPVAAALDRGLRRLRAGGRGPRPVLASGLLLAALALGISTLGYWYGPGHRRPAGLGLAPGPRRAVDRLREAGVTGRALASYNAAAHLVWRLHPRVQVFLDSRNEAYGSDLLADYLRAMADGAALSRLLDRHRVELVLLSFRPERPLTAVRELERRPDFVLIYFDREAAVWLRDLPRHRELIRRLGYRFVSPLTVGVRRIDAGSAGPAAAEAERAAADCPDCETPPAVLAEARFAAGRFDEAEPLFGALARRHPELYLPHLRLGDLAALRGATARAADHYQQALRVRPSDAVAEARLRALEP